MIRHSYSRQAKKKNESLATPPASRSASNLKRTETLAWKVSKINPRKSHSAAFLDGTVSPIAIDSPKFIRTLIVGSLSVRISDKITLRRWNLNRSTPKEVLSILSDDALDRARFLPVPRSPDLPKLTKLDVVAFPDVPPASSDYLVEWMAIDRSDQSDLLAFIGTETAKRILDEAATAKNCDDLHSVSHCLQGALIMGAILTTRADQMVNSMAYSLWTFLQMAHSQIRDLGLAKNRVWKLLNGLSESCMGSPSGLTQLLAFLELTLPENMKREDKAALLENLRGVLDARSGMVGMGTNAGPVEMGEEEDATASNEDMERVEEEEVTRTVCEMVDRGEQTTEEEGGEEREEEAAMISIMNDVVRREKEGETVGRWSIGTQVKISEEMTEGCPINAKLTNKKIEGSSERGPSMREDTPPPQLFPISPLKMHGRRSASPEMQQPPPTLESHLPMKPVGGVNKKRRRSPDYESDHWSAYHTPVASPPKRPVHSAEWKEARKREREKKEEEVKEVKKGRRSSRIIEKGRVKKEPSAPSLKRSLANKDEKPSTSRKRKIYEGSEAETKLPFKKRGRPPKVKSPANEILEMASQLRKETEGEWEREMGKMREGEMEDGTVGMETASTSRSTRQRKPVKLYDPTPPAPKRRSTPRVGGRSFESIMNAFVKKPKIVQEESQTEPSDEERDNEGEDSDDPDYQMEEGEQRMMEGGGAEEDWANQMDSMDDDDESRLRTITHRSPFLDGRPFQMPILINVNGVIQEAESTEEAVEGMMEDEWRMEEEEERGGGEGMQEFVAAREDHSYAMRRSSAREDVDDDEIIDVVTVDEEKEEGREVEESDSEVIEEGFEMDDDVEEIHEIIEFEEFVDEEESAEQTIRNLNEEMIVYETVYEIVERVSEGDKEKEKEAQMPKRDSEGDSK